MDARLQMLRRQSERPSQIDEPLLLALDRAEIGLKEALSLSADDLELIRERGLAFLEAGHADRARALFELLLLLEGEDPATALVLACCYEQLGDLETSRAFLSCTLDEKSGASKDLHDAAMAWGQGLLVQEGGAR